MSVRELTEVSMSFVVRQFKFNHMCNGPNTIIFLTFDLHPKMLQNLTDVLSVIDHEQNFRACTCMNDKKVTAV